MLLSRRTRGHEAFGALAATLLFAAVAAGEQDDQASPTLKGHVSETVVLDDCSWEAVRTQNRLLRECKSEATRARNEADAAAEEIRKVKDRACNASIRCRQQNKKERDEQIARIAESFKSTVEGCHAAHRAWRDRCREQSAKRRPEAGRKPVGRGGKDPKAPGDSGDDPLGPAPGGGAPPFQGEAGTGGE